MPMKNPFDKASRFALRFDPNAFLSFLLGADSSQAFQGWIDARGTSFPGDVERTGDTVARFQQEGQASWAVAIEFQTEPDPLMFGRLLVYLGNIWLIHKPDGERGSRYHVGAVVVNLTGRGQASRDFVWQQGRLSTTLQVLEWNWIDQSTEQILSGVESGRIGTGLLPWVPLTDQGHSEKMVDRWKKLASLEPSFRKRAEFGALACIFADAAECGTVWRNALKGWNMKESQSVLEWIEEGREEGRERGMEEGRLLGRSDGQQQMARDSIRLVLTERFGTVSEPVNAAIELESELEILCKWLSIAATASDLAAFSQKSGL
jgi:hypothetical protein